MKLGLIGFPQTGKKTLFSLLTGGLPSADTLASGKPVSGIANVRDDRFEALVRLYEPKKQAPARLEMDLLPKIEASSIREGTIFRDIAGIDALCHVVRAFTDDAVYHASGSVNPERDIESVNAELAMHDLIFIEKRLERISADKKKDPRDIKLEEELLHRFKDHLENDNHLRTLPPLSKDEERIILSYPFLTRKRMLVVLNVGDSDIASRETADRLSAKYAALQLDVMQVSAKLEAEIASLDSEEERAEFMKESGISETALNALSRLAMKSLGLISFFTVGKDEVKQWPVKAGSSAPEAAGAIHSDIQRGFIRAEVIKYADLMEAGSEEALKKAGKYYLMGKDYIVEEGDIVNFRFNV